VRASPTAGLPVVEKTNVSCIGHKSSCVSLDGQPLACLLLVLTVPYKFTGGYCSSSNSAEVSKCLHSVTVQIFNHYVLTNFTGNEISCTINVVHQFLTCSSHTDEQTNSILSTITKIRHAKYLLQLHCTLFYLVSLNLVQCFVIIIISYILLGVLRCCCNIFMLCTQTCFVTG
jgi:hypothetical protein